MESAEHKVREIRSLFDYDNLLNDSMNHLVIIKFSAQWCGPCKRIAPEYNRLSNEYPKIVFAHVDIDNHELTVLKIFEQINRVPTFVFIKNYEIIYQFTGASIEKLVQTIKDYHTGFLKKETSVKKEEQKKDDVCDKNS